ncbi:MAG: oligoribonuclease [Desulfatibacillaceae bacterium]
MDILLDCFPNRQQGFFLDATGPLAYPDRLFHPKQNGGKPAGQGDAVDARLIWIDLEMTGLDPEYAVIIEIASVVTDFDLNVLGEGPRFVIHQPEAVLQNNMDEWSRNTHTDSGLLDEVRASTVSERNAEQDTVAFLSGLCEAGSCPLAGNSVWQDRRFLVKYMPELNEFLLHRNVDVSTLKELVRYWYPDVPWFAKKNTHTAVSDIHESIEELRFYRSRFFVKE